jgi:uncharacterized cupin superfamily protein
LTLLVLGVRVKYFSFLEKMEGLLMKKTLLLVGFFVLLTYFSCFAAVNVANRTGAIQIKMPDGRVVVVQSNEALPLIPNGAVITILSGTADISATEGSQVSVVAGGSTVQLASGTAINVSVNQSTGAVVWAATAGTVTVTANNGTTATLNAGSAVQITTNQTTGVTTMTAIRGTVTVHTTNGVTTTLNSTNPTFDSNDKGEAYTPPPAPPEVRVEEPTQPVRPEGSPYGK